MSAEASRRHVDAFLDSKFVRSDVAKETAITNRGSLGDVSERGAYGGRGISDLSASEQFFEMELGHFTKKRQLINSRSTSRAGSPLSSTSVPRGVHEVT